MNFKYSGLLPHSVISRTMLNGFSSTLLKNIAKKGYLERIQEKYTGRKYDLAVIGYTKPGILLALKARRLGLKVAMI